MQCIGALTWVRNSKSWSNHLRNKGLLVINERQQEIEWRTALIAEIHPKMPNLPLAQCSSWLRLGSMSGCTRGACTPESRAFLLEVTTCGIEEDVCLSSFKNGKIKNFCRPSHPCSFRHLQAFYFILEMIPLL